MQIGRSHHTLLSPQSMITADEIHYVDKRKISKTDKFD